MKRRLPRGTLVAVVVCAVGLGAGTSRADEKAPVDLCSITKPNGKVDAGKAKALGLDPEQIKLPSVTRRVAPRYPMFAGGMPSSSRVDLACRIDVAGAVEGCEVVWSGGHGFDRSAREAGRQWRFRPLEIAGEPRPAVFCISFSFRTAASF